MDALDLLSIVISVTSAIFLAFGIPALRQWVASIKDDRIRRWAMDAVSLTNELAQNGAQPNMGGRDKLDFAVALLKSKLRAAKFQFDPTHLEGLIHSALGLVEDRSSLANKAGPKQLHS